MRALIVILLLFITPVEAVVLERVVAFVDDEAITLTDFYRFYEKTKKKTPSLTPEEAVKTMINRLLLYEEAKRLNIRGRTPDEVMDKYLQVKIRAFVFVTIDEMRQYYEAHKKELGDVPFKKVSKFIGRILKEQKTNKMIKEHIEELKKRHYIKINYIPKDRTPSSEM